MVAELRDESVRSLPLLFEPDPPTEDQQARVGWVRVLHGSKWKGTIELERRHADDAQGAAIQHAVARFILGNVQRRQLAAELIVCETQVKFYVHGQAWTAYTRPVLRAIERLGITLGRGDWTGTGQRRPREILAASGRLMALAADALEGRPLDTDEREGLVADLRLLAAGLVDHAAGSRP